SSHLAQGKSLSVATGEDVNIATGKSLVASISEALSLFVQKAGIKLFAARGKVQVQAQSDAMELTAEKGVQVTSTEGVIKVSAEQGILLQSGGGYIRIENGDIEVHCPGTADFKGAQHNFSGPGSLSTSFEELPDSPGPYEQFFTLTDKESGEALPYASYRVETAEGEVFEGRADGDGITRKILTRTPETLKLTILDRLDDAQKEQKTAGPGKWVTTDVNKRGIRNFFQMLVKRTETIGDEGRLWGSDGKDFEGTVQDVTQTWTALSASETRALTEQGLVSVTHTYGDTRVITQTYLEGPDDWHRSGKSWHWQPAVRREEFEFVDSQNP
ncbi:DUF2345 domain-containing protein, partial [Marinobacter oulmenensis]